MIYRDPPTSITIRILEVIIVLICVAVLAACTTSYNLEENMNPMDSYLILPVLGIILALYLVPKLYRWLKPRIMMIRLLHKTLGEENLDAMEAIKKYSLGMEVDEEDE